MAIFNYAQISQIRTNLVTALGAYVMQLQPILTEDEYQSCFFLPEHVQALRNIIKIVGDIPVGIGLHTKLVTTGGRKTAVYVCPPTTHRPLPPPLYAQSGLVDTAPPELRARLTEFADARQRAGEAFGDAWDAIVWLNSVCDKASTMKIMFPALPALMVVPNDPDHLMSRKAAKLVAATSFGVLPQMSQTSRKRFQDASAFINAVSLTRGNQLKAIPTNCYVVQSYISNCGDGFMHPDDERRIPTTV